MSFLSMYHRIIIKVGTKVLTDQDGSINEQIIKDLVSQIATLRQQGTQVVLVSSGAVGAGRASMKRSSASKDPLGDKQVYAAVGQSFLMGLYTRYMTVHGITPAQILVTKEDFRDRTHYNNMQTCLENIFSRDIVPIVNENDVIAVKELFFTDNDELAGLLALQLDVDAVFFLTSVDGIIKNLQEGSGDIVSNISADELADVERYVTADKSNTGRGGMRSKFMTARKLMAAGITVYLQNGTVKEGVLRRLNGEAFGTRFTPRKKISARKRKIAHGDDSLARGSVTVNKRLETQLISADRARSLLPVGITKVDGDFVAGDLIIIKGEDNNVLGCGLAKYGVASVKQSIGLKGGRAIIHYDDLFLFG